jgi:hypothetical protein
MAMLLFLKDTKQPNKRQRMVYPKCLLILLLIFFNPRQIFPQENPGIDEILIGATFKALAKVFVLNTDIDKLKKDTIDKLNKMDNDKFRKRCAKVYGSIKDLADFLKVKFGIAQYMPKGRIIKDIESLSKKEICETIDSIPNRIIVREFYKYLKEKKVEALESNIIEQVNRLWNKIIHKTDFALPPLSP